MRKITSILSMFLLIAGWNTASAQFAFKKFKAVGDQVTQLSQLVDGHYYVFKNQSKGKYIKLDKGTMQFLNDNQLTETDNSDGLAVFKLHVDESTGTKLYSFESAREGYYMPKVGKGSSAPATEATSATADKFVISATDKNNKTKENCWAIKNSADDYYFDMQDEQFVGWEGTESQTWYEIYDVTVSDVETDLQIVYKVVAKGVEGEVVSTAYGLATTGETFDASGLSNYSTALFDVTCITEDNVVSSTNKNFTCTLTPKSNTPIELSSASNRKWYSLQTRKAQYDAGQLVADGDAVKCHGAGFNAADIASYEQFENGLWSFELSGYGVKIFNKGKQQYLKSTGNTEANKVTFDASGTVFYMGSVSNGTFNLNTGNADSYVGSHNDAVVYLGGWKGQYISVWTDTKDHNSYKDPGSTFTPTPVDNAEILAIGSAAFDKKTPERSYTENGVLKKGCYDADTQASVRAATTFAEMEKRVNAAAVNVSPEEGAYYLIRNVNCGAYGSDSEGKKKYLTTAEITCDINGDVQASVNGQSIDLGVKRLEGTSAFVPRLWKFEKTADGKYNLLNANTNSYVNLVQNGNKNIAQILTKDNQGQKDAYKIYTTDDAFIGADKVNNDNTTMFVISSSNATGKTMLNAARGYGENEKSVEGWDNSEKIDAGNYWQFIKVTEVPLTIAANDYTTLCLPFNVKLPENSAVKAYYASQAAGNVLNLTEITGIIPANEGVILQNTNKSEAANINLTITPEEATLTGNQLRGVTAKREGYDVKSNYVLADGNKGIGFYKANFTAIPANKAYLPSENIMNAQGVMMTFSFGDEVTGIDNVNAAAPAAKKYYDLQGRRVLYPAKGIFVTEDGQKVLFK